MISLVLPKPLRGRCRSLLAGDFLRIAPAWRRARLALPTPRPPVKECSDRPIILRSCWTRPAAWWRCTCAARNSRRGSSKPWGLGPDRRGCRSEFTRDCSDNCPSATPSRSKRGHEGRPRPAPIAPCSRHRLPSGAMEAGALKNACTSTFYCVFFLFYSLWDWPWAKPRTPQR